MGFWKKLFGSGVETVSAGPSDPTSMTPEQPSPAADSGAAALFISNTGLAKARLLADNGRWDEALAAVDEFLALPSDLTSAKEHLQTLLQKESPSGRTSQQPQRASI